MRRIILAAAAATLTLGPAGCGGSGGGHAGSSGSPSAAGTAATSAQLAAAGQRYSACMRSHGIPDFPDMVVQDGTLHPPNDTTFKSKLRANPAAPAAQRACQPILDALPPSAHGGSQQLSASDLNKVQQFATCMRSHGFPHFPDPKADGSFQGVGPVTPQLKAAGEECKHYLPTSQLPQVD
jgi:hypothetical protein